MTAAILGSFMRAFGIAVLCAALAASAASAQSIENKFSGGRDSISARFLTPTQTATSAPSEGNGSRYDVVTGRLPQVAPTAPVAPQPISDPEVVQVTKIINKTTIYRPYTRYHWIYDTTKRRPSQSHRKRTPSSQKWRWAEGQTAQRYERWRNMGRP